MVKGKRDLATIVGHVLGAALTNAVDQAGAIRRRAVVRAVAAVGDGDWAVREEKVKEAEKQRCKRPRLGNHAISHSY